MTTSHETAAIQHVARVGTAAGINMNQQDTAATQISWNTLKDVPDDWYSSYWFKEGAKNSDVRVADFLYSRKQNRTSPAPIKGSAASVQSELLLAEWDGYVTNISEHYFTASLTGIFGQGVEGEREEAEIPVSDVNKSELDLFQLGGAFRLCVLHEELRNGQPRLSLIHI